MITRIKSDRIIAGNEVISGYVYIDGTAITEVSHREFPFDREVDLTGYFVSPGFIDLHTHGGNDHDFIDGEDAVVQGCNFHLRHGTTAICPTISAAPFPKMRHAVEGIHRAMQSPALKSTIIGAHLEGPYLSKAQCGAQCTEFITPPQPGNTSRLWRNTARASPVGHMRPRTIPTAHSAVFCVKTAL